MNRNKKRIKKILDLLFGITHGCCHMHEGRPIYDHKEIVSNLKRDIKRSGVRNNGSDKECPACVMNDLQYELYQLLEVEF